MTPVDTTSSSEEEAQLTTAEIVGIAVGSAVIATALVVAVIMKAKAGSQAATQKVHEDSVNTGTIVVETILPQAPSTNSGTTGNILFKSQYK